MSPGNPFGSFGQTLNGKGPVFLLGVGGATPGTIDISQSLADARGWQGQKTPWLVGHRYRQPILIRARRLDGAGPVRFARGHGQHLRELRWPANVDQGAGGTRRFFASETLFRAPGCYGFQLDGKRFSETIVVRVSAVAP